MKKVAGTLKLDQAQFREIEAFSKFGSDIDASTKMVLDKGLRNVELLKQPQYQPLPVEKQIAIIFCGINNLLLGITPDKVKDFEKLFFEILDSKYKKEVLEPLKSGEINNDIASKIKEVAQDIIHTINKNL
jgi:F-type H+-transporting ATPase subunit alpha